MRTSRFWALLGCLLLMYCSTGDVTLEHQVNGEWLRIDGLGPERIEFFESGVMIAVVMGQSLTGDYRFIDENTITTTSFGPQQAFDLSITDGTLSFADRNGRSSMYKNIRDAHALIEAVKNNDVTLVEKLLAQGAYTYMKDDSGGTAWSYAVTSGNLRLMQAFVDAGSDVDIALVDAAMSGAPAETVDWLLEQGADPDPDDFPWSPLESAIERRNVEVVSLLLEAGADPTTFVESGTVTSDDCSEASPPERETCINNTEEISALLEAAMHMRAQTSGSDF